MHSCNLLKPLRDQCINCSMSSFVMLTITFFSEHFVFLFKNIDNHALIVLASACFECSKTMFSHTPSQSSGLATNKIIVKILDSVYVTSQNYI